MFKKINSKYNEKLFNSKRKQNNLEMMCVMCEVTLKFYSLSVLFARIWIIILKRYLNQKEVSSGFMYTGSGLILVYFVF